MTTQERLDEKLAEEVKTFQKYLRYSYAGHEVASKILPLITEAQTLTFSCYAYPRICVFDGNMEIVRKVVRFFGQTFIRKLSGDSFIFSARFTYTSDSTREPINVLITVYVAASEISYCKINKVKRRRTVTEYEVVCNPHS